jgi:hypothetical protein
MRWPRQLRWQALVATVPALFVGSIIIAAFGLTTPLLPFIVLPAAAMVCLACLRLLDRRWP